MSVKTCQESLISFIIIDDAENNNRRILTCTNLSHQTFNSCDHASQSATSQLQINFRDLNTGTIRLLASQRQEQVGNAQRINETAPDKGKVVIVLNNMVKKELQDVALGTNNKAQQKNNTEVTRILPEKEKNKIKNVTIRTVN